MALDLTTADVAYPDLHWLYAHATLQRLFRPTQDGRQAFWNRVPGLVNIYSRAAIRADPFPVEDLYLQHYLLEFQTGWVNILGGTENAGFAPHAFSVFAIPSPLTDWFLSYWWDVAHNCRADIDQVIPTGDNRPIVYSGHSLGGASSVCMAYLDWNRQIHRPRGVVSFGCPLTRGKAGMDGRDFSHLRVMRFNDPIPSWPQNLIRVPLGLLPIKSQLASLQHYGQPVRLLANRQHDFQDDHAFRYSGPGALAYAIGAFNGAWDPFTRHYVVSYVFDLRRVLVQEGIEPDPFWDEVNYFLNAAENQTWSIPGFPHAYPSSAPSSIATVAGGDWGEVLDNEAQINKGLDASFTRPTTAFPILRDQSLAAFLSQRSGRDFRDVVVKLYKQPLADPTTAILTDFVDADFTGYTPVGGAEWLTFAPTSYTGAKRYFRSCNFSTWSGVVANNIAGWYAVALEGAALVPVLIAWYQFGQPLVFDRSERGVFIEIELTAV